MLQAAINIDSLMRRRRCGKLDGGSSHLLLKGPARHRSIASYHDDRDFCLPHLHSTPPLVGFVWYGNTRMAWLPNGEKFWRYVYSFTQSTNV